MEDHRIKLNQVISSDIRHVMVAPLNWGLGHATRCIPIINYLISEGKQVTIASDGEALELLQEEFPTLKFLTLPAYNVRYVGATLWSIVVMNVPNVLSAIISEYYKAKQIIKDNDIDLIISDSRFGFRHSSITNYIISHQLTLQSSNSVIRWGLNMINNLLLNAFDLCIVPDYDDHRLSGALSKSSKIKNKLYIGAVSRFKKTDLSIKYDKAYILSGPEPARTKLETHIVSKIKNSSENIVLIRGTQNAEALTINNPNIKIIDRANAKTLNQIILQSKTIISRSGYTSIMDYYTLSKKAKLIPTPGQSEQEYLAAYLDGKFGMDRLVLSSF